MTIRVRIETDSDLENPADFGHNWTPYSFGRRHTNYRDPESLGLSLERDEHGTPKILNPGLRRKLEVGLAFFLSYYEHGNSVWSLRGEGPQCRWDSVSVAGLLVWEHKPGDIGAKTREDRAKDAARFLETYTHWCNGEGLGYVVESGSTCDKGDTHWEHIDSCWAYFQNDVDYALECAYGAIPEARRGEEIILAGDLGPHLETKWKAAIARVLEREAKAAKTGATS